MSTSKAIDRSVAETMELVQANKSKFAREHGVSNSGLRWRIQQGWPVESLGNEPRKPIDYDSYLGQTIDGIVIEQIEQEGTTKAGNKRMVVLCRCTKCGHKFSLLLRSLQGNTQERCPRCRKSKPRKDQLTKEHMARIDMIRRCYNPKCVSFSRYGGRGISVCDRWRESFDNFISDMGPCPSGYSLDRIDVNGNYEPSNCRWADNKTQGNNKRTNRKISYKGIEMTASEWGDFLGVQSQRIRAFIKRYNGDISPFIDRMVKINPEIAGKIAQKVQQFLM